MSPATAVAIPRGPVAEQLQWLTPAPLWNAGPVGAAGFAPTRPWIAELRSDAFIDEFLDLVGGRHGASPDALATTVPHRTVGGASGAPFRLFQPLSQCYYLVSATLVCRRPGIPDRAVKRAKGERTSFVMRLLASDGTEQAWVPATGHGTGTAPAPGSPPTGSWQPAPAHALVPGEETFPMHPAPVAAFAADDSTAGVLGMAAGTGSTRTVFYGYIPVGRRDQMVPALADPVAALAEFVPPFGIAPPNPWLDELMARVVIPWSKLNKPVPFPNGTPQSYPSYPSLYLLLDLADWLKKYLPAVYDAITTGAVLTGEHAKKLLDVLQKTTVLVSGVPVALTKALADLKAFAPLVGGADIPGPATTYDLSKPPIDSTTTPPVPRSGWFEPPKKTSAVSLADFARDALAEAAKAPDYQAPAVPSELAGLIKIDPVAPPDGLPEQTYVIRTVFEHDPCAPVLSERSREFVLARPMDADAPARKIRIQLPDIANMRQFQRGVALEMPPSLRRVIDVVTPDVLKGDGLPSGSLQLGMICSFSLQIIFLCAFIVLFVFLLLLNIVFWWLPFLKICFPIPVKPSSPKAPSP